MSLRRTPDSASGETAAAPDVVAPPPGNPRFPLLDGLRAIAALSVVAVHSTVATNYFGGLGTWEGAYARQLAAGVTVFFLLSGFLLYRPFVRGQLRGTHRIAVRDYVRRRLLRIVPAYWFALTILALWPGLPGSPLGSDWWRYYGFDQDASDRTLFGGLGTAWSLGTEMSFYLVLPVYALLIARLTRGHSVRHRVRVDLGLLLVLSVGSLLARAAFAQTEPQLGYTLLGTFDWFAVGMAVALASALIEHTGHAPAVVRALRRRPSLCWGASFAGLTFAAWYWERTGRYDPYTAGPLHLIWAAIAFFLVLPAAFPRRDRTGVPGRVLSFRLLAWVGLVSYGIYLWHLPLIPKVRDGLVAVTGHSLTGPAGTLELFACVVVLATACAAVSYYVVEQPVLRFKNGFPRRERLELPRLETEPG